MINVTVSAVSVSYIFGICFQDRMLQNSLWTALRCSDKCLNLRPSTVAIPFVMTSFTETPSNVKIAFLYNSSSCQRKSLIALLMEKLLLFQNSCKFSDIRKQDKQSTYTHILLRLHVTIFSVKKRLVLHFSSVPWLSSTQCACAILSSVACPAVQYFSTLSYKRRDFRTKVTVHRIRVLIFSTTFVWNISHQKNSTRYYHKCT